MMMVAAGREEERAGETPERLIEPESAVIERFGLVEAADVQMDMTHLRAARCADPSLAAAGSDDGVEIERVDGHHELVTAPLPHLAWTVDVDLDAQAVRIPEVERFADEVIGH